MKIACISQVRDECDIIELFIRNNSKVIDHFFLINNDSCDSTQEILDRLIAEGFPITVHQDKNQNYDQSTLTTHALKNIAKSHDFDWYCFLDADEFLLHDRATVEKVLAESKVKVSQHEGRQAVPIVRVLWRTVVPTSTSYKLLKNEKPPGQNNCKVIVPMELVKYILAIDTGAHGLATVKATPWPVVEHLVDALRITHLPVRSTDQILSKVVLSHSRIKRNKLVKNSHLTSMIDFIRSKKYKLDIKDLQYMAAMYSSFPSNVQLGEEIDLNWKDIKHKELTEVNVMKCMDYQLSL